MLCIDIPINTTNSNWKVYLGTRLIMLRCVKINYFCASNDFLLPLKSFASQRKDKAEKIWTKYSEIFLGIDYLGIF